MGYATKRRLEFLENRLLLTASGLDLVLVGDSTVHADGLHTTGWGDVLQDFTDGDVENLAVSGSSSATFYDSFWASEDGIQSQLDENDIVLIQFGINDPYKPAGGLSETEYKDFLQRYVDETRDAGGIPVLVTSPASRGYWPASDTDNAVYVAGGGRGPFPQFTREVAIDTDTPLIDLFEFTDNELQSLSIIDAWSKYVGDQTPGSSFARWLEDPTCAPPADNTCLVDKDHTGESGAIVWAEFVSTQLTEILVEEGIVSPSPTPTEPEPTEPEPTEPEPTEPEPTPFDGKIILLGDSTVFSHNEIEVGWGEALGDHVDGQIVSHASHGYSSATFYETHWNGEGGVRSSVDAGDVVLIQFGIEDRFRPAPGLTEAEYKDYLFRFVEETRQIGASPILVTSPAGFYYWPSSDPDNASFSGGGRGDFPQFTRDAAVEFDVPLIDLSGFSENTFRSMGIVEAWSTFVADQSPTSNFARWLEDPGCAPPAGNTCFVDRNHTGTEGAQIWAEFIADQLGEILSLEVDAEPEPTEPEPTDPEPTDPEPTDPEPTEPEPTEPEPTEPEPTEPEPTEPEPTEPEPTEPEPTEPEPTEPEPTEPEPSEPEPQPSDYRFVLIGDSTVGNTTVAEVGWGEVFDAHVEATVDNAAVGGASSKLYYDIYWNGGIRDFVSEDHVVLIQFGIEDRWRPAPGLTEAEYREYLERFIVETRERGATPVLVTSPAGFNYWPASDPDTAFFSGAGRAEFPAWTRDVGQQTDTPVIDLLGFSEQMFASMSITEAWSTFVADQSPGSAYARWLDDPSCAPPSGFSCLVDKNHTGEEGANIYAEFIADELADILVTPTNDDEIPGSAVDDSGPGAIGETGQLTLTQSGPDAWHRVELTNTYDAPVVIAQLATVDDPDPATVRVRNVEAGHFELQIDEWDYLDGVHGQETINYLVLESGNHSLDDGTTVEVGTVQVNDEWDAVDFELTFDATPVILSQVQTTNDPSAVTTRQNNVTTTGFELRVQEEQAADQSHGIETIGYVVISAGANSSYEAGFSGIANHEVASTAFASDWIAPPVLFAAAQSAFGGNNAVTRQLNVTPGGFETFMQEEQSLNTDVRHTFESIGFVAFVSAGNLWDEL